MPAQPNALSGFLFHALTRAHFNAQMAGLRKRGLPNLGSPRILFALSYRAEQGLPPPSQKELAVMLHISPPTIAASLKSLERYGYVSRQTDEKDGRRNLISITGKGRETLLTSRQVFQWVDEYMFLGFTREEREQVARFHRRMLENLCQIGGDEDFGCPPPPPPPPPERMVDPQ